VSVSVCLYVRMCVYTDINTLHVRIYSSYTYKYKQLRMLVFQGEQDELDLYAIKFVYNSYH